MTSRSTSRATLSSRRRARMEVQESCGIESRWNTVHSLDFKAYIRLVKCLAHLSIESFSFPMCTKTTVTVKETSFKSVSHGHGARACVDSEEQ